MKKTEKKKKKNNTGKGFPEDPNVYAVSGLLTQFFRELPEPLLTFDLYNKFLQAAGNFLILPQKKKKKKKKVWSGFFLLVGGWMMKNSGGGSRYVDGATKRDFG